MRHGDQLSQEVPAECESPVKRRFPFAAITKEVAQKDSRPLCFSTPLFLLMPRGRNVK